MRRLFALMTALILSVFCLTGCGTESVPESSSTILTEQEIITQIIAYYGSYGSQADEKVSALLDDLSLKNSEQGALWRDITDYWKYANTDLPVNTGTVPDNLPDDDSLVLVVLGYALNADGTMADELIQRLETALSCAKKYPNAYVVCTGGATAFAKPYMSEGGQMGKWLLRHGLDKNRLIVENASLTTAQNALNTYEILLNQYPQITSAAIISSDYHIPWGSLMFESVFLRASAEYGTPALHVVSNCACKIDRILFTQADQLRWEASGLTQIAADSLPAAKAYHAKASQPE